MKNTSNLSIRRMFHVIQLIVGLLLVFLVIQGHCPVFVSANKAQTPSAD